MKFSDILKYMYTQTAFEVIPVSQEMEYIRQYVDLQSLRLNRHSQVKLETWIEDGQVEIPLMILITFVENTFKIRCLSRHRLLHSSAHHRKRGATSL
ncbi:histidine kinase [Parabacteroides distasonis]|uniref:histidine kinase n=1 Tax=Parabacteroides distasonis TaxID=823 RepID=UPI0020A0ACA0|nr:histidine kinase [Parabacteroides distasonis]